MRLLGLLVILVVVAGCLAARSISDMTLAMLVFAFGARLCRRFGARMLHVRPPGRRCDAASLGTLYSLARLLCPRVAVTLASVMPITPSAGS